MKGTFSLSLSPLLSQQVTSPSSQIEKREVPAACRQSDDTDPAQSLGVSWSRASSAVRLLLATPLSYRPSFCVSLASWCRNPVPSCVRARVLVGVSIGRHSNGGIRDTCSSASHQPLNSLPLEQSCQKESTTLSLPSYPR